VPGQVIPGVGVGVTLGGATDSTVGVVCAGEITGRVEDLVAMPGEVVDV
jgi:hypothetical protein